MLEATAVIIFSYLIGVVPVAYIAGRVLRGIDIREYGSGNIGPSNVWQNVSKPATIAIGLIEIAQGATGIILAKATGQSLGVQSLAGVAAVGAHNWCPLLGFAGGRGVGLAIGFMLALSWPALVAFIVIALTGVVLRAVPQFVGLALIGAPVVSAASGQESAIVVGLAGIAALIMLKRALGNDATSLFHAGGKNVLVNRLVFDRDTRSREAWVRRTRA